MKLSVAICTWNRSRLLRQTLEQFTKMKRDDRFSWELIIVDNNSTDDTSAVIQSFTDRLPIVSLFEAKQGHSHSRNRAVAEATGDYMVWTDNDVLVSPNWLVSYFEAFQTEPDASFFGSSIEPWFEPPGQPEWLRATWEKSQAVYATRMLGDKPIELNESLLPYGANFAMRMDVQRANLFQPQFGRVGSAMVGEDETFVLRNIARSGGTGRWVPGAIVRHIIPNERATEAYVRAYFVGQGHTNVVFGRNRRGRLGALLDALCYTTLYRWKRRSAEPDQWVSYMIRASISWGEFQAPRSQQAALG